jgi:hypothetical protein
VEKVVKVVKEAKLEMVSEPLSQNHQELDCNFLWEEFTEF